MNIRNRRSLKQSAASALSESAYPYRKLFAIYCIVSISFSLLVAVLDYLLTSGAIVTEGIAGVQNKAILTMAQMIIQWAGFVFLPFWQYGLLFVTIGLAAKTAVTPRNLLAGFRRFGPLVGLMILSAVMGMILAVISYPISLFLFFLTPAAGMILEPAMAFAQTGQELTPEALEQLITPQVELAAVIYLVIFVIVFLAVYIPLFYRVRLAGYFIMDMPQVGAFQSILLSWKACKKNGFALFLLDLSYWWYYLLSAIPVIVCDALVLLPQTGIPLPVDQSTLLLVSNLAYALWVVLITVLIAPRVQTTYAAAYQALKEPIFVKE